MKRAIGLLLIAAAAAGRAAHAQAVPENSATARESTRVFTT